VALLRALPLAALAVLGLPALAFVGAGMALELVRRRRRPGP
jgi:hypothetical protein